MTSPCLSTSFARCGDAREDRGVDVEGLALVDVVGQAQLAHGDLARHGAGVGDGEELDAVEARAVGLGEQVAVGLHAVGEDHGAAQVPFGVEAVRELQGAGDVRRGAQAGAVALDDRGGGLARADQADRLLGEGDHARALGERHQADEVVLRAGVEGLLQGGPRVVERRVGNAVADVDEVHRADLLRRRRAREPREAQREHGDERDAQRQREHPLRAAAGRPGCGR